MTLTKKLSVLEDTREGGNTVTLDGDIGAVSRIRLSCNNSPNVSNPS